MSGDSKNVSTVKRQFADGRIDRREFLRLSTLLGLSAGAAYAFAGKVTGEALVAPARAADIPMGGRLRLGMAVQDISSPHTFAWVQPRNIVAQVCEYLAFTDWDNITRPYLLQSWEASDDLRTWTFKVQEGVKWHNGRPFTAEDAAWNIRRVLNPENGSSVLGLMKAYMTKQEDGKTVLWDANAIEVVDPMTLRLNLAVPQIAVPEHFFHYPFLILDPEENGKFGVGSNGTGPFTLVEHTVGDKSVLRKKEGYWGQPAYLDEIVVINLGDDPAAPVAALASQQVDLIYEGDVSQLATFQAVPHLAVFEAVTAQTAVARFQVDQKPFDDPRVRKAMRLAVDTERLLELGHYGLGAPGEHHAVAPIHPEYAKLPMFQRDVEAAKALLAEAGHPDGIDIQIACKSDPAWELTTIQAMVEQLKEAGIRVKVDVMPAARYWDIWTTVPFGFTSWGHRPLGIMVLGLAYRTGVPWNESHYSNPRFDELLAKAEATLDVEERRAITAELETIMQEDGPIIQPLWRASMVAGSNKLVGYRLHPSLYIQANSFGIAS